MTHLALHAHDRDTPHCPNCGFDLTGLSPGWCPECGDRFDPAAAYMGRAERIGRWLQSPAEPTPVHRALVAVTVFVLATTVAAAIASLVIVLLTAVYGT